MITPYPSCARFCCIFDQNLVESSEKDHLFPPQLRPLCLISLARYSNDHNGSCAWFSCCLQSKVYITPPSLGLNQHCQMEPCRLSFSSSSFLTSTSIWISHRTSLACGPGFGTSGNSPILIARQFPPPPPLTRSRVSWSMKSTHTDSTECLFLPE